jgi:uncharacterized membrane protein
MRYSSLPLCCLTLALTLLGACHGPTSQMPGDRDDHQPWHAIAATESVRFTGTEPFWSGEVTGATLIYLTPEDQKGERIAVTRFAGRGGLSFSGRLTGGAVTLAVTPGDCSDGMSDRHYPFTVTLQIGSEVRQGCAWTDRQPFSGDKQP